MHIPDGFLSPEVCVATGALSLGAVAYSLHQLKDSLADRTVPLTGMMSALIFAGQMVNFPLIGTSGHILGGVLAAVILGPWASCLALTLVLVVQCLLFGDGGILSLGANILHMAVIGSLGGYAIYSAIRRGIGNDNRAIVVGAVIAAWLSVMAAACLFCIEFLLSQGAEEFSFLNIFTLMVTVHSVIGVAESLITGLVVSFVLSHRPDLIYSPESSAKFLPAIGRVLTSGVVCALAVAAFLAPFASALPDGLEAVAEKLQFKELESDSRHSLLTDYELPLPVKGWQGVSVSLAGIGGTLAVLIIAIVLGRTFRLRSGSYPEVKHVE